ncbi:response regulator [Desulfobacter latus]|uniref:Response regulator n=1 Tax=Desulfobacter latus TaxID=2292 RepID=A0A850SW17_9BACT|nr:response regulator [Desulfobacter latus]NWH04290.1 response regulator [Desulfobacter latus]
MASRKILVVDDERAILTLLKQSLSRDGYEVKTAQSGQEALNILENESIHVMFIDLNLPEMDGIELCRKIKKLAPMAVLYAITGYASIFQLAECREAGFEDYFKKPVNIATLRQNAASAFERVERWRKY